ncbi:HAMP domain-containing sensor histidine kinase [Asanoa sp. NPDC049518]|uniref:sensor histidine kinase n=1 Tax=unclassified Asanoa TaxID=2685164 RepID=UPI00343EEDFB
MTGGRAPRAFALAGRLRWHALTLRSRIALISATAVAISVVAVSGVVFLVLSSQLHSQLDNQLVADSHTVADAHQAELGVPNSGSVVDPDGDHDHDIGPRVQLLDATGRPRPSGDGSRSLPVTAAALTVVHGERVRAFEDVHVDGQEYRMLTAASEHGTTVQVAADTGAVEHPLARIGVILVLVSTAGVGVATALGFLVARTALTPVHRLTHAVEHVAVTNDLTGTISVEGRDEIARLAAAFNAMLGALGASRAAQRLLVEDAGHELRTPLTSLRANIELLDRADRSAGTGRVMSAQDRSALLRDLDVQVTELTELVGELVDLAREDSGEVIERVDLADLVGVAAQRVRQRWPEVPFVVDLAPVTVPGRPASLERMVANLLDNAAKWGGASGPVRVVLRLVDPAGGGGGPGIRPGGPGAELTVADSGPGIDPDDLPHVFERFYRATAARAMPGSGLGLAIVAQAVKLHDGTVKAGRSATGGALFTVHLPALSTWPPDADPKRGGSSSRS